MREAPITPHQRSAVWGYDYKRSAVPLTLTVLLALVALPLSAQHRDTLYVIEEEPVYDTLCVHDTLYRHDTITLEDHLRNPAPANKIHPQTVTLRGNPVFNRKQEKLSSMDSIFNSVNFFQF